MALVTLITALPVTVVVSVLICAGAGVAVAVPLAVTVMIAVRPAVSPAGTIPIATKRNEAPAARGPLVVMGVALSGKPSPLASAYNAGEVRSKLSPAALFATLRLNVSDPFPVLRTVCG